MLKRIYDTSLPKNWTERNFEEYKFDLSVEHFDKIVNVLMIGTAGVLNNCKSKSKACAMVFRKLNKDFIAAAICQYFDNEDPKLPGNFSLSWTFYEEDIPKDALIVSFDTDKSVFEFYIGAAGAKYQMDFDRESSIVILCNTVLEEAKKWLDENAREEDEIAAEVPGVCLFRAAVENGEKVFAIEPVGEIKALIKNDALIEK